jgi:hypothetical protein
MQEGVNPIGSVVTTLERQMRMVCGDGARHVWHYYYGGFQ